MEKINCIFLNSISPDNTISDEKIQAIKKEHKKNGVEYAGCILRKKVKNANGDYIYIKESISLTPD